MIIQNAIKILGNPPVYLRSRNVHDYRALDLPNGNSVAVDGGNCYIRRGYKRCLDGYEEFNLLDTDPFEVICDRLLWGTCGPKRSEPLKDVRLTECSTDHLKAIKKDCPKIVGTIYEKVIDYILASRCKRKISHKATRGTFKTL